MSAYAPSDGVMEKSWLQRSMAYLRWQVRQEFLLSAYPHPDSFTYPSRYRLLLMSGFLALGHALYAFYSYFFSQQASVGHWFNGLLTLLSALLFTKVYFRRLTRIPYALSYAILLVWALPLFFFINYFAVGGRGPALAHLCIALLLYTNLLHWRVGAFGVPLALGLALLAKFFFISGSLATPLIDSLFIAGATLIGLVHSYSFSVLERERSQQAHRILQVIGQQLQKPLGIQLALSEALRYEAVTAEDAKIKNRLFELAEKLDARANQTRIELEHLQQQTKQLQDYGSTQLLHARALGEHIRQELNRSYGFDLQPGAAPVSVQCDDDVFVQGELTEVVQMLASVNALLLRAQLERVARDPDGSQAARPIVHIRWKNHKQHSHLEYTLLGGLPLSPSTAQSAKPQRSAANEQPLSSTYWLNNLNRANHRAVGDLLPAYSLFVLNKLEARIRFSQFEEGLPRKIQILIPLPRVHAGRNKTLPASLLAMYQQ